MKKATEIAKQIAWLPCGSDPQYCDCSRTHCSEELERRVLEILKENYPE
jgi:hypothetical protein